MSLWHKISFQLSSSVFHCIIMDKKAKTLKQNCRLSDTELPTSHGRTIENTKVLTWVISESSKGAITLPVFESGWKGRGSIQLCRVP